MEQRLLGLMVRSLGSARKIEGLRIKVSKIEDFFLD